MQEVRWLDCYYFVLFKSQIGVSCDFNQPTQHIECTGMLSILKGQPGP